MKDELHLDKDGRIELRHWILIELFDTIGIEMQKAKQHFSKTKFLHSKDMEQIYRFQEGTLFRLVAIWEKFNASGISFIEVYFIEVVPQIVRGPIIICDTTVSWYVIPHISKVGEYLPEWTVLLLSFYLFNHNYVVHYADAESGTHPICAGIREGGVLGPLLYLYVRYTADILTTSGTITATFADDTAILALHEHYNEAIITL